MEKKNWIESDVLHHFKTTSHSSPNAILHQQLVLMNRLINSRPSLMHSISRSFVTIVEMKGHCSSFKVKSSAKYETKRGTESKLGQIIKKMWDENVTQRWIVIFVSNEKSGSNGNVEKWFIVVQLSRIRIVEPLLTHFKHFAVSSCLAQCCRSC